jgi:dCMP deaminase
MDTNNAERISWDDYFKEIVQITAKRSPCKRLNVGCLLVKDNRIISQGYNGFLPGAPHESVVKNNSEQCIVHAEQNAISDCAKRGVSCLDCTAYVTHHPCIKCFLSMASAGIKDIKYINDYKNDPLVQKIGDTVDVTLSKI